MGDSWDWKRDAYSANPLNDLRAPSMDNVWTEIVSRGRHRQVLTECACLFFDVRVCLNHCVGRSLQILPDVPFRPEAGSAVQHGHCGAWRLFLVPDGERSDTVAERCDGRGHRSVGLARKSGGALVCGGKQFVDLGGNSVQIRRESKTLVILTFLFAAVEPAYIVFKFIELALVQRYRSTDMYLFYAMGVSRVVVAGVRVSYLS